MTYSQVHGQLAHFALNVDDLDRAAAFYQALFGWELKPWGPPGFFLVELASGEAVPVMGAMQGRRNLIEGQKSTGPECSFAVRDVDVAIKTIEQFGASIVLPKSTIPGVGHLAFFKDLEGNVMGVIQYDEKAG